MDAVLGIENGAASFEPHPFLREAHAMTLASLLPRALFGARAAA